MERPSTPPENDITQERYKGPSAAIAALGEGAWAHWAWLFAGVAAGGVLSAMFHEKVNLGVEKWRGVANGMVEKGPIRSKIGKFSNWLIGSGKDEYESLLNYAESTLPADKVKPVALFNESQKNGFVHSVSHHLLSMLEWCGKAVGKESTMTKASPKLDAFVIGGGITGLLAGVGSTIIYGNKGWKNSRAGRDQHTQLKEELIATRGELEAVREQYVQTKLELDGIATGQGDSRVKITPDATPAPLPVIDHPAALAQVSADSPTEITAPKIEGVPIEPYPTTGRTLPREEMDSPNVISKPPIKTPVLGPEHAEHVEHHAKREHKGDKAWAQHVQDHAAHGEPALTH